MVFQLNIVGVTRFFRVYTAIGRFNTLTSEDFGVFAKWKSTGIFYEI